MSSIFSKNQILTFENFANIALFLLKLCMPGPTCSASSGIFHLLTYWSSIIHNIAEKRCCVIMRIMIHYCFFCTSDVVPFQIQQILTKKIPLRYHCFCHSYVRKIGFILKWNTPCYLLQGWFALKKLPFFFDMNIKWKQFTVCCIFFLSILLWLLK